MEAMNAVWREANAPALAIALPRSRWIQSIDGAIAYQNKGQARFGSRWLISGAPAIARVWSMMRLLKEH